jgi:serine phosphatase RsbU (regulator of sigma subunit)/HAMP domain-containing protein
MNQRAVRPTQEKMESKALFKVFDFFALWDRSSLKSRLSFVQTFILVVSVVALLVTGITLYRSDKLSYVYENHYLKTSAVATRLKLYFSSLPRQEVFKVRGIEESKLAAQYNIPQMPAEDQIFVGRYKDKVYIFGRAEGEMIWRTELDPNVRLFEGIDGKSYISNSFGIFLASYDARDVNSGNFAARPGTKKFIKSGLREGFTRYTDGKNQWIISFREIPGTNVIVFVETSLASLNAPIRKFAGLAGILALSLVGLVILVTDFLLLGLLRPLREIVNAMFKISAGQYDITFNVKFDEELNFVARGLQQMAQRLQIRETELRQISSNLEFVMKISNDMALSANREECIRLFINEVRRYAKFSANMDATGIVFDVAKGECKGILDYIKSGVLVPEPKIIPMEDSGIELADVMSSDAASIMDHTIIIRAFSGSKPKLFLLLDGFPEDSLNTTERHLMNLLSGALGHALVMFDFQEEQLATVHFENELVTAEAVQASLLPSGKPEMNADLDFYYEAATRCGGDWLFFDKSDNSPWLHGLVGDVTGHGVPAAIMTGVAYGSFMGAQTVMDIVKASDTMGETERLEFMASILNRAIMSVGKSARLMTMCLVSLNTETGELYYASAGHTPLLWFKSKTKKISPQTSTGNPLGVSLDRSITVKKLQLEAGDLFAMYTDGLLENHGPKNEMLSKRRFYDLLASGRPVTEIREQIMSEAKDLWGEEEYADDVTMMIVRWPAQEKIVDISFSKPDLGDAGRLVG